MAGGARSTWEHTNTQTHSLFARRTIYTFISIQSIMQIEIQSYRQSSSRMKHKYSATGDRSVYMYICIYTSTIYSVSVLTNSIFSKNRDSSRGALSFFSPDGVKKGVKGVKKGVKGLILVNSRGFALWSRTKIDLPGTLPVAPGCSLELVISIALGA